MNEKWNLLLLISATLLSAGTAALSAAGPGTNVAAVQKKPEKTTGKGSESKGEGWTVIDGIVARVYGKAVVGNEFNLTAGFIGAYAVACKHGWVDAALSEGIKDLDREALVHQACTWVALYQMGKGYGQVATNKELAEIMRKILRSAGLEDVPIQQRDKVMRSAYGLSYTMLQRLVTMDIIASKYVAIMSEEKMAIPEEELERINSQFPRFRPAQYIVSFQLLGTSGNAEEYSVEEVEKEKFSRGTTFTEEDLHGPLEEIAEMSVGEVRIIQLGSNVFAVKLTGFVPRQKIPLRERRNEVLSIYRNIKRKEVRRKAGAAAARKLSYAIIDLDVLRKGESN